MISWPLVGVRSEERWLKDSVDDTHHCSNNDAAAAVRRSSNTSADLPTDASGFTARWLSCEGEPWFASFFALILPTVTRAAHNNWTCRYRRWRDDQRQRYEFVNLISKERSPERQCVPLTSWCAFLRWNRGEKTALAAADGCPQGDSLLADTAGWYNVILQQQRHSKSVWNAAVSPTMQSDWEDCHCHWRLEVSDQVHFHSQTELMDRNLWRWHWCTKT